MPKPDDERDLEALIKATEDNRAELKKTQQKMESLESAIRAMQNSRLESEQKRGKRNSNKP
jgi:translation initiation factor 2B subunit (eIF-2B alpha/beta/delta family)